VPHIVVRGHQLFEELGAPRYAFRSVHGTGTIDTMERAKVNVSIVRDLQVASLLINHHDIFVSLYRPCYILY